MTLFKVLFALFIIIPLIEISLIIQVGKLAGVFNTIALIVFTAALGVALLKTQGISTLSKVQHQMDNSQLPAQEMIEGVMLLFTGALLLTPGFFTDVIGFLILIPGLRIKLASHLLQNAIVTHTQRYKKGDQGTVIEGEYHEVRHQGQLDEKDQ